MSEMFQHAAEVPRWLPTMSVPRSVVLIAPSYESDPKYPAEKVTHDYLVKCKLLPAPLDQSLYQDLNSIKELFSKDSLFILDGQVKAKRLTKTLRKAALETDVLVIIFVGHGILPVQVGVVHATLYLSQRDTITSSELLEALADFSGTLIEILNTCSADGLPPSALGEPIMHSGVSNIASSLTPWIRILSSEDKRQSVEHGCAFLGSHQDVDCKGATVFRSVF